MHCHSLSGNTTSIFVTMTLAAPNNVYRAVFAASHPTHSQAMLLVPTFKNHLKMTEIQPSVS